MAGILVLGIDDETVAVTEMIGVTALLLVVDAYWWWQLVFKDYASPPGGSRGPVLEFKFWQSLALWGVLGGFWVFGPFSGGGSELVWLWPALALGPVTILFVRMMMGFAGWPK